MADEPHFKPLTQQTIMFKLKHCAAAMFCLGAVGPASASMVVSFTQVGSDVVMSYGAGTIDTTGLSVLGSTAGCDGALTGFAQALGGGGSSTCSEYLVIGLAVTQSTGWMATGSFNRWTDGRHEQRHSCGRLWRGSH